MKYLRKYGCRITALILVLVLICPSITTLASVKVNARSVTITNLPSGKKMTEGTSHTFKTRITAKSGRKTTDTVKWQITKNTAKATITSKGVVKVKQSGKFTLTARTYSGKKVTASSKPVTIKVIKMTNEEKIIKDMKTVFSKIKDCYEIKSEGDYRWTQIKSGKETPDLRSALTELIALYTTKINKDLGIDAKIALAGAGSIYYQVLINEIAGCSLLGWEENGVQKDSLYTAFHNTGSKDKLLASAEQICYMSYDYKNSGDVYMEAFKGQLDTFCSATENDGDIIGAVKDLASAACSKLQDTNYSWYQYEYAGLYDELVRISAQTTTKLQEDYKYMAAEEKENGIYNYKHLKADPAVSDLVLAVETILNHSRGKISENRICINERGCLRERLHKEVVSPLSFVISQND